jgi:hypothetical protein
MKFCFVNFSPLVDNILEKFGNFLSCDKLDQKMQFIWKYCDYLKVDYFKFNRKTLATNYVSNQECSQDLQKLGNIHSHG